MSRHIPFTRLFNFRDLGGYTAADGRTVHWGRLYRSDSLGKLTEPADRERFAALGVRTVIDLRYDREIAAKGRIPEDIEGIGYHNLSIEHRPYDQAALTPDDEIVRYLADRFAEVAEDGTAEIRRALEVIAGDGERPVVFHCASGKDRTGIIAALVLSALGVSDEDIAADFALTGLATRRLRAQYEAGHPDKVITWPYWGQAPAELMRAFLEELAAGHGSVRGYVTGRLGLGEDVIEALRERYLTP